MTTTRKNPVSTPYPTGAITDKSAINKKAVLVENKSLVMVGSRGHCSHALAAAQGMASDDKLHTYLVTGGSGCHPEALGTKIFLRDTITGKSAGYCRRESIEAILPEATEEFVQSIPAYLLTGMRMCKEGHPELVGLSFTGLPDTVWIHRDTLGEAINHLRHLHMRKLEEDEAAKVQALTDAKARLKHALSGDFVGTLDDKDEEIRVAARELMAAMEGR